MTTGENAGTWGDNTNTNLNFIRDMFKYIEVAMTADRTLTIPDNSPGGAADILKPFLIIDGTTRTGSDTITFKVTGQTGITIPKYGNTWCYKDGTDIRTAGFVSTRGSAGTAAAQPAYTFHAADGTNGQALVTDGSGSADWGSAGISTGKAIAMAMIFG